MPISFLTNINIGKSVGFTNYATGSITYCDAFSTGHGEASYHYYDSAGPVTLGVGCVIPGIDPDLCDVSGGHYWLDPNSPLHNQYHGQTHANDNDVPQVDLQGFSRNTLNVYTDMGAYESDERTCP